MQKKGFNRKGEIVWPVVLFIILNLVFFSMLFYFVHRASGGGLFYEQLYAKNIALTLDRAVPGMKIIMDITPLVELAKDAKYTKDLVTFDPKTGFVTVRTSGDSKYLYKTFNGYNVNLDIKGSVLVIMINELNEVSNDKK